MIGTPSDELNQKVEPFDFPEITVADLNLPADFVESLHRWQQAKEDEARWREDPLQLKLKLIDEPLKLIFQGFVGIYEFLKYSR